MKDILSTADLHAVKGAKAAERAATKVRGGGTTPTLLTHTHTRPPPPLTHHPPPTTHHPPPTKPSGLPDSCAPSAWSGDYHGGNSYYAFEFGLVHVVVLNSYVVCYGGDSAAIREGGWRVEGGG